MMHALARSIAVLAWMIGVPLAGLGLLFAVVQTRDFVTTRCNVPPEPVVFWLLIVGLVVTGLVAGLAFTAKRGRA